MVTVLVASPPAQPARGGGRTGRGRPKGKAKPDIMLFLLGQRQLYLNQEKRYHTILDCHAKTMTQAMLGFPRLEWRGTLDYVPSRVVSFLKAHQMVGKECDAYLAYVRDVSVDTPTMESILVVRDYPDRWLELLKDYDITILYHLGKPNVVADALSRKAGSLGSLAYLLAIDRPLALDVQALANQFVRLDVLEPSQIFACVVSRPSLYDRIRECQYDDICLSSRTRFSTAVPRKSLLGRMVKYENLQPGGLLQRIEIQEWKWERITMDLIVGLSQTRRKFGAVWVIVDKLTKSDNFIPVVTTYSSEQLAQLDKDLSYVEEPMAILDRQVRKLKSKKTAPVKVLWRGKPVEEATWETEHDMRSRYPHLFTTLGMSL
ncbi:uncharacterized protein [Nicotiana tomentosiformis]|uniref:uncharacterized protein n=1 Tax=Nicotiana tomentosiformis TaxID=4098 RepID=UPI00388C78C7